MEDCRPVPPRRCLGATNAAGTTAAESVALGSADHWLADAGARLALGSDQHAVVDAFEEARGLEMDERLASGARGRFRLAELEGALTRHDCLGFADAGRIEVGARADLGGTRSGMPSPAPGREGPSWRLGLGDPYRRRAVAHRRRCTGRRGYTCPPAGMHWSDLASGRAHEPPGS